MELVYLNNLHAGHTPHVESGMCAISAINNPCVQLFWVVMRTLWRPWADVLSVVWWSTPMYAGAPGACEIRPAFWASLCERYWTNPWVGSEACELISIVWMIVLDYLRSRNSSHWKKLLPHMKCPVGTTGWQHSLVKIVATDKQSPQRFLATRRMRLPFDNMCFELDNLCIDSTALRRVYAESPRYWGSLNKESHSSISMCTNMSLY